MAVKASATITLTSYRDTQSVTRYYKLQPAGSSAPLKPETKPPSSDWTDSEPACDISKELYFCDLTIFSNGEWEYSKVSKSTSYEAAKEAYNKAQSAKDSIDNLDIGGRNLLINSGFKDNSDGWDYPAYISGHVVKDRRKCAHINHSELNNIKFARQSILGKLEPNTQYIMSGWFFTENVVKGTTNFMCMFYHDGQYNNNGSNEWYSYGSKELPLNAGKWTHVEWTFTTDSENTLNAISSNVYVYTRDMTGDIYFYDLKLEKGNKATDWTPAPEDVDAGIANAQETADSIANNIYVPDSTLLDGSKISDGSLSINQMDDTVAGTYSDPTTKKGTMEWNDDALHIKSTDANAQNTYETVIGGDGIKFNWNGVETASINQDELRINKTVVINAMEVGNWSWAIHPTTGNLMVKWNGGE